MTYPTLRLVPLLTKEGLGEVRRVAASLPPPGPLLRKRVSIKRCAPRYAAKRRRLLGANGLSILERGLKIRSPRVGPIFSGAVSRGRLGENRQSLLGTLARGRWRRRVNPRAWVPRRNGPTRLRPARRRIVHRAQSQIRTASRRFSSRTRRESRRWRRTRLATIVARVEHAFSEVDRYHCTGRERRHVAGGQSPRQIRYVAIPHPAEAASW